ncbi:DUF2306 domain-containing protein [Fodinicola feengrottensis]|uniref:DUF2306 domain-containing protein n=2 Tax=Fodinicola feengrottensis TaxID=435914 RepID=A0ABP4RYW3_9ACTN
MLIALLFLAFSLPPYTTLNPQLSRVPSSFPLHYPFLVAHIGFASVAMLTACLQIWPWFRQRYPIVHRRIGRVYVFAGVLPAGVCGLIIGAASPYGPPAAASDVMLAVLWLTFTAVGFRMARKRRFADHRRWMIRSFALTFSIITNRIWGIIFAIALPSPSPAEIAPLGAWLGWTTMLLLAEWWLVERGVGKRRARRAAAAAS